MSLQRAMGQGSEGLITKIKTALNAVEARNSVYGVLDQLIVSGTNFLAMIIVARSANLEEVGRFVLVQSVIFVLMAFLDAMVARPYAVQIMKPENSAEHHAGTALSLTGVLAAIALALSIILAFILGWFPVPGFTPTLMMLFGFATVASLLREFARRHSFAEYASLRALKFDLLASFVILALLLAVARFGTLNADVAILIVGLGALPALAAWWWYHSNKFSFSRQAFRPAAKRNWSLGKWFTIGQMAMQFQSYSNYWLAPFIVGTAMTGAFAEAMSVISLTNPFVYGLLNVLMPKSVRTLHHQGQKSLEREVKRDIIIIGSLMAIFVLVVYFGGEWFLRNVFGSVQNESAYLMTLLAIGVGIGGTASPLTVALQSQERGEELAYASIIVVVLAFALSAWLIWAYGLIGAGWALILTEAYSMAQRYWLMYFRNPQTSH